MYSTLAKEADIERQPSHPDAMQYCILLEALLYMYMLVCWNEHSGNCSLGKFDITVHNLRKPFYALHVLASCHASRHAICMDTLLHGVPNAIQVYCSGLATIFL